MAPKFGLVKAYFCISISVENSRRQQYLLLKAALNSIRKHHGQPEVDAMDFLTLIKNKVRLLEMDEKFLFTGR